MMPRLHLTRTLLIFNDLCGFRFMEPLHFETADSKSATCTSLSVFNNFVNRHPAFTNTSFACSTGFRFALSLI